MAIIFYCAEKESAIGLHILYQSINPLSLVVIFLVKGVLTRGQLGLVEIIHQYIRYDEIQEAINVLSTMNWNTMGQQCFICLSAICNHLLKQKLTPAREGKRLFVFLMGFWWCLGNVCVDYDSVFIDCTKKTVVRIQIVSQIVVPHNHVSLYTSNFSKIWTNAFDYIFICINNIMHIILYIYML